MFQVPYQGIIPSGGYSVGTVDWLGSFETAFDDVTNQRGFSRRIMRGLAVNFALMQLRNNTFKDVQKITIDGNFAYVAASPKPTNLISNMQLLYNETFGIYVQKDKSTGDFYQPYSNIKVDPGALVYNAKLEAFLKSMSGGAGHGAANRGDPQRELVATGVVTSVMLFAVRGVGIEAGAFKYKGEEYGIVSVAVGGGLDISGGWNFIKNDFVPDISIT
jgi:hypothetical protein